jgi:hypothetical protein
MAIITTGNNFGATDAVTSTTLNNIANAATFDDPVDGTSLELKVDGKLGIKDAGVTKAKMENVANLRVLGNTSGSAVAPQEVEILDDDTMATATDTTLATSESIKAYTDSRTSDPARNYNSLTHSTVSGNTQQNTTGRPLWVSFTLYTTDNTDFLIGEISPNSSMSPYTRIGQMRIHSDAESDSGAQVTMIVPDQWYWKYTFLANQGAQEMVHCSFML